MHAQPFITTEISLRCGVYAINVILCLSDAKREESSTDSIDGADIFKDLGENYVYFSPIISYKTSIHMQISLRQTKACLNWERQNWMGFFIIIGLNAVINGYQMELRWFLVEKNRMKYFDNTYLTFISLLVIVRSWRALPASPAAPVTTYFQETHTNFV